MEMPPIWHSIFRKILQFGIRSFIIETKKNFYVSAVECSKNSLTTYEPFEKIEDIIFLAASLASGSLSFNNSSAIWTSEANQNSLIPSIPWAMDSYHLIVSIENSYVHEKKQTRVIKYEQCYHLRDTIGDRDDSFGPDSHVVVANIMLLEINHQVHN